MVMWLDSQALEGNQVDFSGPRGLMKNWNKGEKKICDGALPTVCLHFQFRISRWTSCAYPILACQLCVAIPFFDYYLHLTCNEPQDSCIFGISRTFITTDTRELFGKGKKEPSTTHNMNWASFSGHIQSLQTLCIYLCTYTFPEHILCLSLITLI